VLEDRFQDIVEPEVMAHHLTEAARFEPAIKSWARAGQLASQRSANVEAVAHLQKALSLVPKLPESAERNEQELRLLNIIAAPLMNTNGYAAPETGAIYERSYDLCRGAAGGEHIFQALSGICQYHMVVGDMNTALSFASEAFERSQRQESAGPLLEAHRLMGLSLALAGQFPDALRHLTKVQDLYDHERHQDLALVYGQNHLMSSYALSATPLAIAGYPDQAHISLTSAIEQSLRTRHFYSQAYAMTVPLLVLSLLRDTKEILKRTEQTIAFCTAQSIVFYLMISYVYEGFACAHSGQLDEGIEKMQQGVARYQATGSGMFMPHYDTILAEALMKKGRLEDARGLLNRAIDKVAQWGEAFYDAETHRVMGDLELTTSLAGPSAAEAWYRKAIEIARGQEAKLWELRAATSLSRLWRDQGRPAEAREVLGSVYHWFTEGFETADLKAAKALFDQLA
jgi:predicted ATPase